MIKRLLVSLIFIILVFGISTQFTSSIAPPHQELQTMIQDSSSSEDLVITISQNASAIGAYFGINFTITLLNNGSGTMNNVNVNISTTSSNVELTPPTLLTYSNLSSTQQVVRELSAGLIDPNETIAQSVDLVLVVDSSGSMGQEIRSVQTELNNLVANLVSEIPNLRIGVVVYGWNKYSEYPMSNPNNYVELTNDFNAVKSLINELNAAGGTEPWGDALYLANTWDWRDLANKLIIMVGDEDCDPGNIVGRGHSQDWYNGSELLDVVTNLKEKGVIISTVVTENPDLHVENQFQWIANYTGGTSVYLPDLEQAVDPTTLPELIQEWTLELSREFAHKLIVNATWSEGSSSFTKTAEANYWIDFAAPSIIHYEQVTQNAAGLHDVQIIAEVRDRSDIANVALYHNAYGSWNVEQMVNSSTNSSDLYVATLYNLASGFNLTFFIEASDVLRNSVASPEYWLIVETVTRSLGETAVVFLDSGETEISLIKPGTAMSMYLWLTSETISDLTVTLTVSGNPSSIITPELDLILDLENDNRETKLFEFSLSAGAYQLAMTASEGISEILTVKYTWLTPIMLSNQSVTNDMTVNVRKHLYRWTIHDEWYLIVDYMPYSDLVVLGHVFYGNWTFIGNITVMNAVKLQPGTYFVVIHGTLRTGEYKLLLTDDPSSITDTYYYPTAATSLNALFVLSSLVVLLFIRKKRRKKDGE